MLTMSYAAIFVKKFSKRFEKKKILKYLHDIFAFGLFLIWLH